MKKIFVKISFLMTLLIITCNTTIAQNGNWSTQRAPYNSSKSTFHFVDENYGWKVEYNENEAKIYKTIDGGLSSVLQHSGNYSLSSVFFVDINTGYYVGNNGLILFTHDGGDTWVEKNVGFNNDYRQLNTVHFIDKDRGWTVGFKNYIYPFRAYVHYTEDGGITWVSRDTRVSEHFQSIFFIDSLQGWAVGNKGKVIHTTDKGNTWNQQNSGVIGDLLSIYFINSTTGWIIGQDNITLHTTDGGVTWNTLGGIFASNFSNIHFSDSLNGWITGGETFLTTNDGGKTWNEKKIDGLGFIPQGITVRFINKNAGWMNAWTGAYANTVNGGSSWNLLSEPNPDFRDVYFENPNTGWAVGAGGLIFNTTDGGINWKLQQTEIANRLSGVHFSDANNGWVVGSEGAMGQTGTILHTNNGGATWVRQTSQYICDLRSVFAIDAQTAWAVGFRQRILHTIDGGNTWDLQSVPYPTSGNQGFFSSVFFVNQTTGWAVGEYGNIYKTIDKGENWIQQNSGTNKYLFSVDFINATTGWVAGTDGTILNTKDGGNTWTLQQSGITGAITSIQFVNSNKGWAVGGGWDNSPLIFTNDGGLTWQADSTMNNLRSICFIDATTGWGVGDVGSIFQYTNKETSSIINIGLQEYNLKVYPNPFSHSSTISFVLKDQQHVNLKVFDLLGREVVTLSDQQLSSGEHRFIFNGIDQPAGIYLYHLQIAGNIETGKMILSK